MSVFSFQWSGEPRTGVRGLRRRLSCVAVFGLWLCAEVMCPLTPDPSPPAGARGELQAMRRLSCVAVLGQWLCAEVMLPPHPRPLSPCGGEGGIAGDAAVELQCCVGAVVVC